VRHPEDHHMAKLRSSAERVAMSDKSYLSELPADLKAHILRRLTPQMLLSCLQSSKAFWHEDDESLWRTLCKHHLPAHMTKFLQEPTGRLLRSRVDVRRTLFHGLKRQQEQIIVGFILEEFFKFQIHLGFYLAHLLYLAMRLQIILQYLFNMLEQCYWQARQQ
jgi:hypothetical protein